MRDNDTFQLVLSKFNPPVPDNRCVVRPRLLSTLDSAVSRKLSLISAPAGYGKTTVVVQWLNTVQHPSVWLSLDDYDSDLNRFLRYLIGSIHKAFPRFGSNFEALLSSPLLPPVEFLADTLIADLAALPEPLIVVLDDFHSIGSEPVQLMSRLIHYLPDHLHLVILTRVDPPFPLATWHVRGWYTEIRAADLRFFQEEAHAYFSTSLNRQLPDHVVEKIIVQTEGWAVGIQTAAISLASARDPEAITRQANISDQIIVEFLMEEVLNRQPDEVKDFLAVTSLLETFSAPLCNYIARKEGQPQNSVKIIAHLQKENLFLISLDSNGFWYRYHNLFQIFLVKQMEEALPQNRRAQIFQYAGAWSAEQGNPEEGLRFLIKAGDLDAAAELIGAGMHTVIDYDNSRNILIQWLDMLPKGAEKNRPTLLVAHAYVKVIRWDLAGIAETLDEAEALLKESRCGISEPRREVLSADIEVLRAFCLYWKGDAEGALQNARRYLGRGMPWNHHYAQSLAITYAAGASALCGQTDEALLLLEEALEADCKEGSPNTAHLLIARALIHLYRVNFTEVEENVRKAVIVHERVPQPDYWMGYVPYLVGSIAYERNFLDEAADHFSRITEHMRYRVNSRLYHDALIGMTVIACARGEEEKTNKYADRAFSFAIEAKDSLSIYFSELIQIRLAILSGDLVPDPPQLKKIVGSSLFWLESPSLINAEYLISNGTQHDCRAGLAIVEKALPLLRRHHNVRQEIQHLAVKSLALKLTGKEDMALDALEDSVRMAEPHGLVRSFVNRGPSMAELINDLSTRHPGNQYLKTLLKSFGVPAHLAEQTSGIVEIPLPAAPSSQSLKSASLSNRERDILLMLQKRLTNKEIAQELNISPITVKSHSINIYRKLNVHGRRQAVDRAKQLGLLRE